MADIQRLRRGLGEAMTGTGTVLADADRLCQACVELLGVDGAAISLLHEGTTRGTFGSSGPLSRRLDDLQFTFGEGPCLDAVQEGVPVLVDNLEDPSQRRWPAFTEAILGSGITAVFALPVVLSSLPIGALDLFRLRSGPLTAASLTGALLAAQLAALPLLDVMTDIARHGAEDGEDVVDGWDQLAGLERIEVYQATGMLIDMLDLEPVDALARLRAYAYSHGLTASETAWAIIERRLDLPDDRTPYPGTSTGDAR